MPLPAFQMERHNSGRPSRPKRPSAIKRNSSVVMDSDDELEIYDYKLARQNERAQERLIQKPAHQSLEGIGHQHQGPNSQTNDHSMSSDEEETRVTDEVEDDEMDEDDDAPRHPYYTYGTEKADVHADSKLIYQRHRMDTMSEADSGGSPSLLARSLTLPEYSHLDGPGLGRATSLSSRRAKPSNRVNTSVPPSHIHVNREPFPTLQDHAATQKESLHGLTQTVDSEARAQVLHPGLPQEFKDPMLTTQDAHGPGAGVGDGPTGFVRNDAAVVSEVQDICDKIKHILDLRQAYTKVSLQSPGDNPKDTEDWHIYPPPPEPVWNEEKAKLRPAREDGAPPSASSSVYVTDHRSILRDNLNWDSLPRASGSDQKRPTSPATAKKRRKAGTHIGEDFDFDDCYIPTKATNSLSFKLDEGSVYQVYDEMDKPIVNVPTLRDYYKALDEILDIASDGPAKSFAYRRLQYLEGRYGLYTLLNEYEEVSETKKVPHRDFYNVRKVDTHVHHSACMNQKHLLRFIKSKMKKSPEDKVYVNNGKVMSLKEVFESINLTAYDLSIDTLDMHAHTDSFHRFDKFNLKYNPVGQSRLRDIFLKTDNFIQGRYLADITREVISDLESSKYQMVEWRISVYGRNINEWDKLAAWVVDNKLFSHNVRWLIQVPRLFAVYKAVNNMDNFEEVIRNIFQPLFEVTQDPSTHPKLHIFLQRVIGFDSVDDESKAERRFYRKFPTPKEWSTKQNPPYSYWIYYLFANMASLNAWRKQRGFNTFLLRPHCGEAGDTDHLAAAILCCHSISHGITLRKVPLLQYIFYLEQIGIAMSPLSNNALFLTYDRNPFISYFKKGMNVSLSTDDPLQFAFTKEPLIEEYSVAAQIYKLSSIDMCELAKHSVDQCGFELQLKQRWLGRYCYLPGMLGNDVRKCNVPDIREAFRHETLKGEHYFIAKYTSDYRHLERCTPTVPDPKDPSTPSHEVYKTLESPKTWYSTLAESYPGAPLPPIADNSTTNINANTNPTTADGSGTQGNATSPRLHRRTGSKSSIYSKGSIHEDDLGHGLQDLHISAAEPRPFPGVHQAGRRRRSSSLTLGVNGPVSENTREE